MSPLFLWEVSARIDNYLPQVVTKLMIQQFNEIYGIYPIFSANFVLLADRMYIYSPLVQVCG